MKNRSAYLLILVPMLIWSASFLLTRYALDVFRPITLVTIRMALATTSLFIIGRATKCLQHLERKDVLLFLAAGFLQPFCYFMCEAYGLTMVSPTIASVVLSTIPLFAPLMAFLLLRERVTVYNMLGIMVSLAGVLMLVLERGQLFVRPLGILLLMMAVFSAVMYTIILRKIPKQYSDTTIVFYIHAVSLLFFVPAFLMVDLPHLDSFIFDWSAFGAIVALALFSSSLAYVLYTKVVRMIGVTRASAFCNIQPASTALLMFLIFGEHLSAVKWMGVVVVIGGLFISQAKSKTQENGI